MTISTPLFHRKSQILEKSPAKKIHVIKNMSYQKKGITKPALFFDPPPVEFRGEGFPTRNRREVYLKFSDLEADADRFARFRQYTPQNAKLRK